ncbi:hypothetical protein WN944_012154 [Citrus x changshan-huyou]|uniref:Receptor-like serine/threonine-protein kinase n=1 Tax=Citrus x changshan-huyou TaxID=2935761 RepID=A0AAP0QYS5_9ROSI
MDIISNSKHPVSVILLSFFLIVCSLAHFGRAVNTITKGQSIKDGESLISNGEIFELGFFSPENSSLRYVGIWYHQIDEKAVVWVANRNRPISDERGTLTIGNDGNLMVLNGNSIAVWSSNASVVSNNTAALLEDDGNLILTNSEDIGNLGKAYWQSFNHPTDTHLPGMRVGVNSALGENRVFTSWKSASDPSPGNFTMGVDPQGSPQIVIWEQLKRRWRSGQWNSVIFTGVPTMATLTSFLFGFKLSPRESDGSMYFTYVPANASYLLRFRIGWDGNEEQLRWDGSAKKWSVIQKQPADDCELYNFCGNFGICNALGSTKCTCMEGFVPKHFEQWRMGNWSAGCIRRTQLQCQRNRSEAGESGGEDGFKVFKNVKLPDFADVVSVGQETCKDKCLQNCSCNAYADINGIGCMLWRGELIDVKSFEKGGNLLHVRLPDSELGGRSKISNAVIAIIVVIGALLLGASVWLLWRFRDPAKQALLDWTKRFAIIEGIARGLLYLHRDSRLRIIHRDLKASNILLDEDMNPKISDFGMARIFGFNQNEANTNRVVGTYGYMAPEYAMEGLFSVKSDVYSFGVLLLEIVSGRRNTSFRLEENSSLIEHAWNLWNEGKAMDLVDPNIRDSSSQNQVLRCIHVGMLCVQDSAMYRPTMASVVLMLENETPTLPVPRQPTFTSMRSSVDGDHFMEAHDTVSSNDLTVTMVVGR